LQDLIEMNISFKDVVFLPKTSILQKMKAENKM